MSVQTEAGATQAPGIEFRLATPADARDIAELYHDVYLGSYPIAECTDPALIEQILADDAHIWVLAVAGSTVVGASVGRPEPQNHTYELCRAAVRHDYTGRGNFAVMFDMTVQAALAEPDCELVYGYARSERARRLFSRVPHRICWVGTDGGQHLFLGDREEHLIGVSINPSCSVVRVLPPKTVVAAGSPVDREVGELAVRTVPGIYPSRIAPGGAPQYVHESAAGSVAFSVFAPSRTAFVTEVFAESPAAVRELVWQVLDGAVPAAGPIEHMTFYVLADKLDVVTELCSPREPARRFTVRGYLPAWYRQDESRYDCVILTTRTDTRPVRRNGLDDLIDGVYASFPPELR
ncbi:GNAT family N-acetyltransferase [Nocardia alba]|uniref:N-acetyltransferase domain-containing protein n=1 Tax=Nocardia alba TaxID=225051 RepID=A0A4R1FSA3_9NOCA|nr:GNAT family N-acetyltransferase [Nocardia alba]TCJ97723.1 hypothetical protein DFR71_3772 [Nocardia alba]